MENIRIANERKIQTVIKAMGPRNIIGHYCEDKEAAVETIMSLIPEGSLVSWGGSATLNAIGVKDAIKGGNYEVNDPMLYTGEEAVEARRQSLLSDVFLASANAVTLDGKILNIDGMGNRVAATMFGPKKVIMVVGANKIVSNNEEGMARIKSQACPPNAVRLGLDTPCAATGVCANCKSVGNTICSYITEIRFNGTPDRLHVVFVNDNLGF